MAEEKQKNYHVPNLNRALDILELLAGFPTGLTMMEIAERLEFPTNSVFRVTTTMTDRGYLLRNADSKRFTLAPKLIQLGYAAIGEHSLVETAMDVMRDLRDIAKETVLIGTLVESEGIILEQVRGLHAFTLYLRPGTEIVLHASAPGKALLAHLPAYELDKVLPKLAMPAFTKKTITKEKQLRKALEEVRAAGYALDRGEWLDGVRCAGAPVFNQNGYPIASIWITGPVERMPDRGLDKTGRVVREHADRISERLGYAPQLANG